jgi:hypothetical protein
MVFPQIIKQAYDLRIEVMNRMKKRCLLTVLCAILICGLIIVNTPQNTKAQSSNHGITRVQSVDGGVWLTETYDSDYYDNATGQQIIQTHTYASNQTSATLPNMPKNGNVLIAVIGENSGVSGVQQHGTNVSSVNQTGVTWTRQTSNFYLGWQDSIEIWLGVVGANADQTITITIATYPPTPSSTIISYVICKYSGISTVSPLDQTAVAHDTAATTNTGQTSLTSKPNELWIGAVLVESSVNQTVALNGFSLVGGTAKGTGGRLSTGLLDRVVDKRGQAWSGTEISAEHTLVGYLSCIATFVGSDQTSSYPDATLIPNPPKNAGTELQFSCQSTISSTIKVNMQGTLTGNGAGIPNELITFSYSINNGATFTDLASVFTDNQGHFNIMWNPSATGSYQIKANWAGNSQYPAFEKTVNFGIVPAEQSQSLFSINSNSTISALNFDSSNKQLSFTVSGESGTKGYVGVYIPKTLMSDVSGLEVKLDGSKLDYTLLDQGDAWLITFTYHHSTHQVTMNLNAQTGGSSFDGGVVGWILIAVIIIPLASAITYIATKRSNNKSQTDQ